MSAICSLTGLINYYQFKQSIAAVAKNSALYSVSICEMDKLLPHIAIDKLKRLFDNVSSLNSKLQCLPNTKVGYVGTGEYFIFIENFTREHESEIERITDQLNNFTIPLGSDGSYNFKVSCQVGYSVAQQSTDLDNLAFECKVALLSAARGGAPFYYHSMNRFSFAHDSYLVGSITTGVQQREMSLHFQPLISSQNSDVVGAEALVRWNHKGQSIPPDIFIPLAEKSFEIIEIGEFVISESVNFITKLRPTKHFTMSINVSPHQLTYKEFFQSIKSKAYFLYKHYPTVTLQLELTERVSIDFETLQPFLELIRDYNVNFAIDDFGTGYSSFSYLAELQATTLKIDRSMLIAAFNKERSKQVYIGIVKLALGLGFTIVAEGVETEDEANWLREIGCHRLQGYLFDKPMPENEFKSKYSHGML